MPFEDDLDKLLYGIATVGERGQVVIPAHARKDLNIKPGDKVLVFGHPRQAGVMLVRPSELVGFTDMLMDSPRRLQEKVQAE